jgi:hypothetical protein
VYAEDAKARGYIVIQWAADDSDTQHLGTFCRTDSELDDEETVTQSTDSRHAQDAAEA